MATEKFQYLAGTMIPGTKYKVIRLLGAGGMGTVYEVEDTTIDKRYVLKTLHATLANRKDLIERMQREAKALAKLEHRNIVQVITADVTGDSLKLPYFVMQKLNGHTLRTVLDHKGQLEIDAAIRLSIDLLGALYHAHENSIIHRDVKPENIFLHRDPDGLTVPKLLDFGVMATTEAVTMTGQRFIGTLRYAAPEQLMGEKVSPRTDLYAAALVLYECLAGRGPFEEEGEAMKIARAHIEKAPPLLSQFRNVPPSLERLVMRSLAKSQNERHDDAFGFAADLHRFLRELRGSVPPDRAGGVTTVPDVLQGPPPDISADAMRALINDGASQAKTPAGAISGGNVPSSGSAPTRPNAPLAGATLPASALDTKPLRPVGGGGGDTPPQGSGAGAGSGGGQPVHHRGATIEESRPPTNMSIGDEPEPLRVAVAREAARAQVHANAASANAVRSGAPVVDRQAVTNTMVAPLPARDGKTEMIDSMVGEGLAQAGTPPARIVRRIDAEDAAAKPEGGADAVRESMPEAVVAPRVANETSAAGSSSRTLSQPPASSPSQAHPPRNTFAWAMGAIISLSLVGAAALLYASRVTAPPPSAAPAAPAMDTSTATKTVTPATEPARTVSAPASAPSLAAAPSASASAAPAASPVEAPPLVAAPTLSARPIVEKTERKKRETSTTTPTTPRVSAGLEERPAAPAPAASEAPRRRLPGSGL